ncbi:hypothetical protein A3G67_03340 [Candidatus Roizmanbacteria bacterium RIFCSPLOWO2_12_FULL_40_12]|uniref:Glycosyltransferase RgtA/B/C/D-like domain-containing protein n=1 Tax=Candidatus Roizmanbacteria bacterium RIFCSPLOWO2_01_FULL_40_42 TaxID=1802066 RepID=A0A1F7J5H5_9BACT|nr:MAG: hypothetical protein A2779_02975 [Candidatus Roizmanbacteria bacterium RIFCSPHIGHO2_01_FULL_40_98]OGK28305.1 MAG: hypothetical protein A3C31_00340 [Candidatus Roizmanbacteria bacterium RIFCSPHIGHO2_02_FULL_40_53]OGK30541.1 MAG: hypothetical protein A2W49_03025 [Candidatus Roizmanbacteria bacterium RIFCSPHIGHO2_12_41_18]OGK36955.1 MAG: hypothetical protein A3E69_00600 [Candidatus Roizmanbacteria bacterium RIFCSPHIGHO2_12_FULL_40_130]OGK50861.1 MAG: hypothetical protein A3B50_01110 [Candi
MQKIKRTYATFFLVCIVLLLFSTRFINLSWGLPNPFHPDERNIAVALQQLSCPNLFDLKNCLNPHFFAYGQFPLYTAFFLISLVKLLTGRIGAQISYSEAVLALRIISAVSSLGTALILLKIGEVVVEKKNALLVVIFTGLFGIFSPVLIQFAHFGTTESLLAFYYSVLMLLSVLLIKNKISKKIFLFSTATIIGLSIATKVSATLFVLLPISAILFHARNVKQLHLHMLYIGKLLVLAGLISVLFSPHNVISVKEFLSSIKYEVDVARGLFVFYTRSFEETIPVLFQFKHIFPYALGLPIFIFFLLGFFLLPWKKEFNFLRASFLIYFLPTSFLYAKWTRFMAPAFPVMILISSLFLIELFEKFRRAKLFIYLLLITTIIPGLAYLSIYTNLDTRLQATKWIYQNIPENSYLLSETANVVDIPIPQVNSKKYIVNSFDFYNLDEDVAIQNHLQEALKKADYIFVPSRRIYKNHTCETPDNFNNTTGKICKDLKTKYPFLNEYYEKLFSQKFGFRKVAEFSSYPKIELFDKTIFIFPDESAEETWTVFDHPVIRIYKKNQNRLILQSGFYKLFHGSFELLRSSYWLGRSGF